jgi:hypothetical protein
MRIGQPLSLDAAADIFHELYIERAGETADDLVLCLREVGAIGVEAIRPDMRAALRIDELNVYSNLVGRPADAAFEDVPDTKLPANLSRIGGFALKGEGRVASDHKASGNPRQIRCQIVGDAVGEIFLIGIAGQVRKGEDDHGQARRGRLRNRWNRWHARRGRVGEGFYAQS